MYMGCMGYQNGRTQRGRKKQTAMGKTGTNKKKKDRGMIWCVGKHTKIRRVGVRTQQEQRGREDLPLEVMDALVGGLEVGLGGVVLDDEFIDFGL